MIILLLQNSVDQSLFDKFPLFYQIHFPLHSFWITWFSWRDSPMTICVRLHLETKKRKIFSKKAHWKKRPTNQPGLGLLPTPTVSQKSPHGANVAATKGKARKANVAWSSARRSRVPEIIVTLLIQAIYVVQPIAFWLTSKKSLIENEFCMNVLRFSYCLLSETRSLPRSRSWVREVALICAFLRFWVSLKTVRTKKIRSWVFT